jgi:DnaJ-domain-containing protein 1
MNRLVKNRIADTYSRHEALKYVFGMIGFAYMLTFFSMVGENDFIYTVFILPTLFSLMVFFAYLRVYGKNVIFNKNDRDILIIALNFLNYTETDTNIIHSKLEAIFSAHSKKKLHQLISKYEYRQTKIFRSCRNLSSEIPEIRYFALYSLMDLASLDGLYSLKEEEFIDKVRQLLKIHSQTFQYIKNAYLKKGLQEERKILEEQSRKAFESAFVPFNAYQVLGITPEITIDQLKQQYRNLAKKFHPDGFIGQSEEFIHQAEEKFNEITLAYHIILKHLKA